VEKRVLKKKSQDYQVTMYNIVEAIGDFFKTIFGGHDGCSIQLICAGNANSQGNCTPQQPTPPADESSGGN